MTKKDIEFMKSALKEAGKGIGRTSPNPAVGAVVVKNGKVVGKGYHRKAGAPHAEINALAAAVGKTKGSTLYVTLEPCNHTGRTPPCTEAILNSGIKRVVVGMLDPNPSVNGGGCDYLAGRGLSVSSGVLDKQCQELNRPFIKHITTGLPWVILKAGASVDGRIATGTGHSSWITNEQSRLHVHRLRNRVDAIMVGIGTALADDPLLTTRLPNRRGQDPLRVILDTHLRLPSTAKMLQQDSSAETWVFCGPDPDIAGIKALENVGATVKSVPEIENGRLDLKAVLVALGKAHMTSVLVEGGSKIHGEFLRVGLADEAYIFIAPIFIGADGVPLISDIGVDAVRNARKFETVRTRRFGNDVLINGLFAQEKGSAD